MMGTYNAYGASNFTVINEYNYSAVVAQSRHDIMSLIKQLQPYQNTSTYLDQVIIQATNFFLNRPYIGVGAEGEGDWSPYDFNQRGYPHIQQDPVYRTDSFVCNTFVQTVLALLHANNLSDFEKSYLTISYGTAGIGPSNIFFYNRNNFTSIDFNPVNQRNGILQDVTDTSVFSNYVKTNTTLIDRQAWFNQKFSPGMISKSVRVLHASDGPAMVRRAQNNYPQPFHQFPIVKSVITYIPKSVLVLAKYSPSGELMYHGNEALIQKLPTPAVVEIVRDPRRWTVNGKLVSDLQGTNIDISHLGFIHKAYFKQNQLIYHRVSCQEINGQKICTNEPIYCQQPGGCTRIMFDHATDAYTAGCFYPNEDKKVACNRVTSLPLGDYLASFNWGHYIYMDDQSLLGIHVEKINDVAPWRRFK